MSYLKAGRPLALFAFAVCLSGPVAAAPGEGALALTLRQEVQLAGARILLGDVVTPAPGSTEAIAPELAGLDLGAAPRVNAVERLTRAQIGLLIRRRLQQGANPAPSAPAAPAALAWDGAESVSVQRLSQPVSGAVLAEAAVGALLAAYGPRFPGLQASAQALPADVEIAVGTYTIQARALDAARLPARAAVWLDLLIAGQVQRSVVVPVMVVWQRPAYVARRALPAGQLVQPDDFEVRAQDVAGMNAQPVSGAPSATWRLRRAMQAGQVLARELLPASGAVFPGDAIRVQTRSGAIGIEIAGVVQAEAVPGQLVVVRAPHSSDTLTGRLTAAGTVVIE